MDKKEMIDLGMNEVQINYAITKCCYESLNAASLEIEKKVLDENPFYILEDSDGYKKGDRVLASYEIVNNSEQWNKFLKLYYAECDKQGIAWEWNKTIDGDAFYAYMDAEEKLLNWFIGSVEKFKEIKKISADELKAIRNSYKTKPKLIDLAMKWNSKWEKYSN